MKKFLLASLAVGLVGAGCAPFAEPVASTNYASPSSASSAPQVASAPPTAQQPPMQNNLKINSQQKGSSVVIDTVTLAKPSFVVIHQDVKGKPGLVLATSELLPTGESQQKKIPLLLTTGKTYWAEIRADDGDRKWNEALDPAVATSTDRTTITSFEAIK
jgi:hypothetical protein